MTAKKHIILTSILLSTAAVTHAQLFEFTFQRPADEFGDENTSEVDSQPTNATVSVISRGSGIGSGKNDPEFNYTFTGNNFVTDATLDITNDEYFTFTVTPDVGFQMDLTSIEVDILQQRVAPEKFVWRSDIVDSFGTNLDNEFSIAAPGAAAPSGTINTTTGLTANLDNSDFGTITGSVEFRLYGWDAIDSSGQRRMAIDNLQVFGSVSPVPEPSESAALMGVFGLALLACRRKRS